MQAPMSNVCLKKRSIKLDLLPHLFVRFLFMDTSNPLIGLSPPQGTVAAADAAPPNAYCVPADLPVKCCDPIAPEIGPEIEMPIGAVEEAWQHKQKQRHVLELMMAGAGISEAARLSAVSRVTVHRWVREDPDFAGALQQWRQRVHESARNKLAVCARLSMSCRWSSVKCSCCDLSSR